MSEFLRSLRASPLLADGGMGSYIFERTGRLSEMNHVYEVLNVDNPEVIRGIHLAYLQAGARCLTTNTFGANRSHLSQLGRGKSVAELNRAAVRLAKEAIADFRRQTEAEGPYFALGSIGPTPTADEGEDAVRECYREQVGTLVAEKVDALILETFDSQPHLEVVLSLIREMESPPPVIAQMALRQTGADSRWSHDPRGFVRSAAGLGAQVVGVNCLAPWEASAFFDAVHDVDVVRDGDVLLSAMPNAGGFQRIGHRYMTHVNPEYMGKLARTLSQRGVRLIGGCCEVHPAHIAEMSHYLIGLEAGDRAVGPVTFHRREPVGDGPKKANGRFSRKIKEGKFAISVEILPPRGTGPKTVQAKVDLVGELAASRLADAVDVTDGSRGIPLMPPGDFITVAREGLGWERQTGDGVEFIPHFTTRDLNLMGLQSRLIGYHGRRIHNVLFVTGDPPKMSPDYPRSTAVFDLDSVAMVRYAHFYLNAGVDFGDQPLGRHSEPHTHFTIGSGFEPEAVNPKREIDRLRRKIDSGVDYIMTQPAFRFEALEALGRFRAEVPILVGVLILTSLQHAQRIGEIPGVIVPRAIYDRLCKFRQIEDQAKVGREIALEQIGWIKQNEWAGLYLMSPASLHAAVETLKEIGAAVAPAESHG